MGKKQTEKAFSVENEFLMKKIAALEVRINRVEARLDKNDKEEG